jgi:hypothetical protein
LETESIVRGGLRRALPYLTRGVRRQRKIKADATKSPELC